MSKIRLHVKSALTGNSTILREKEIVHKLKNVLRVEKNQPVYLFDGKGQQWQGLVFQVKEKEVVINQIKLISEQKRKSPCLVLAFPLTQDKKISFILQKATELGAGAFLPYFSQTSAKFKLSPSKRQRWEKIIKEACRQSERLWIPQLKAPVSLDELVASPFGLKFLASSTGKTNLTLHPTPETMLCLVGPEGGFKSKENETFLKNRFNLIRLSPNLLRTETAAIFSVGLIKYLLLSQNKNQ